MLPPADEMAATVTDSLNYHLGTDHGSTTLHALLSSLTAAGLDATQHQAAATLTTAIPDGAGAIAM
jgi:hypothetical protein